MRAAIGAVALLLLVSLPRTAPAMRRHAATQFASLLAALDEGPPLAEEATCMFNNHILQQLRETSPERIASKKHSARSGGDGASLLQLRLQAERPVPPPGSLLQVAPTVQNDPHASAHGHTYPLSPTPGAHAAADAPVFAVPPASSPLPHAAPAVPPGLRASLLAHHVLVRA